MYKVDTQKWHAFSTDMQFKNIAAELERATKAALSNDKELENAAFERAIILLDASITDPKWKNKTKLYQLRDAIAALYTNNVHPAISNLISKQILLQ